MFIFAEYTVSDVFNAMNSSLRQPTLPDGRTFKKNSARLTLFNTQGVACVTCGIEGSVFVMESQAQNITPHLNLYAVTDDGTRVLMTKDHILPKSKGGANALENYNTMCSPCNAKKANHVDEI